MGAAASTNRHSIGDDQKLEFVQIFVVQAKKERPGWNKGDDTAEEKVQFFNELAPDFRSFAKASGFTDKLISDMEEQYAKFDSEDAQTKKVSCVYLLCV
jgi:hypothetical protein